ncbi:MAG: NAD(P)H-hydrate dehydratase [Lachnospiraceae bacterium]|nr:NAD(P)H-hydrate dehydratase [Lachnospiraceae bacterium]
MKMILTAAQMKAADNSAILQGVPSLVLMERAALSVVHELMHRKQEYNLKRVCIFCGTGNNAGDGVAIGRILKDYGYDATLILVGPVDKYSDAMVQQVVAARNRGVRMLMEADPAVLAHATLIIDALFGIGLTRDIQGAYADAIALMNQTAAPIVAVDIPSGIHTDTGKIMGTAVKCSLTVTFARAKRGLLLFPGADYAGEVVVKEIGIPVVPERVEGKHLYACEEADLHLLPTREESGNKGTFKKILVIAGSRGIFGAAALCAEAAMRSGAGMVKVFTEEVNRTALCSRLPEALISTYKEGSWDPVNDGIRLQEDLIWADAVVIGPGLGTSGTSMGILAAFLNQNDKNGKKPTIFDADALNLLAMSPSLMKQITFPAVFTPHLGEMARLGFRDVKELKSDPVTCAEQYAKQNQICLVMKDARTVIAAPDGKTWLNTRGNSALATAGSGDVLAGIMGTVFAQAPDLPEAPALAVLIHALSGEKAAEKGSRSGVIAGDLLKEIPGIMPE